MANTPTRDLSAGPTGVFRPPRPEGREPGTAAIQADLRPGRLHQVTPSSRSSRSAEAIAAFEASGEISQFSSKYDASNMACRREDLYTLIRIRGAREAVVLRPGANASPCHSSAGLPAVQLGPRQGKDTFTMYCYANIGVPKNPRQPFYEETDPISNPNGYNPLGTNFIDCGLGGNPTRPPTGPSSSTRPRATSPSSGVSSRPRRRATSTSGRTRRS